MIQVEDLTVRYGDKTVLENFSLCLPGEGVSFLSGASGAGKTTLLRVLAGLREPEEGRVRLPGRPLMLFQEDRLFPGLSARRQVEGVLPREKRELAGRFLELTELEDAGELPPGELSGGMARRLSLARCLAAGETLPAGVYLLDEPFAGVDLPRALRILERLRALGKPVLVTGHSPDLARACDRAVEIKS